jgi:threonine/homoserine efflux transporter RhtA
MLPGGFTTLVALPSARSRTMSINLSLGPVVSLIAGILILIMPRLLNYIIAVYLIVIGLLGLFDGAGSYHSLHFR